MGATTDKAVKRRFTAQRRDRLVQLAQEHGSISVGDVAELLGVSQETIRKDIIALDKQGLLKRSRGGAMPVSEAPENPIVKKSGLNMAAKQELARYICDLIPDGSSVILDSGSSICEVANLLAQRSSLTLFTNSLVVISALADSSNDVFVLGGHIRRSSGALVGDWPLSELASIQADYALVGADSISSPSGPAINSYEEVAVKQSMLNAARTRVLMADASKLTTGGSFRMCGWDSIDLLVTNAGADVSQLREHVAIREV